MIETVNIINRVEEIRLATTRLDNLIHNVPVPDPVLFFYGVPYVGKTTLLNYTYKLALERQLLVALLDFDREQIRDGGTLANRYDGEVGFANLVDDLFVRLRESRKQPGVSLTGSWQSEEKDTQADTTQLISFIRQAQKNLSRPIALLFDTLEDVSPQTFIWLQERILSPLLQQGQLFVVMAGWTDHQESQQSLIWSVSRFTKVYPLRPFDAEETETQLQKLQSGSARFASKNILALTGGIPGLNKELASQQKDIQDEMGMISYLVNEVIFRRFSGRGLDEVRKELIVVAPFRQFDTRLFQHLLERLWPTSYKDVTLGQTRNLLRKLRLTSLVQQHPETYGYAIPHDLRRVLDSYFYMSQTTQYLQISGLAVLWFRQEISDGDCVMVVNELYHLAGIWRYAQEHSLPQFDGDFGQLPTEFSHYSTCLEHLHQRLVFVLEPLRMNNRTPDWVEKIIRTLKGDEFRWVLTESEIEQLLDVCRAYLREEFDDYKVSESL